MPHIMYTMFSLIPYAPKQITHVQTIISEHERNGAKWEVGHIAIYLTKRDGGGELGHGVCRGSSKREGFGNTHRNVCVCACMFDHTAKVRSVSETAWSVWKRFTSMFLSIY